MALEDTNGANTISRENYEQDKKILDITAKDNIKDFDINIDLQFENAFDSYIKANAKSSLLLINNKEDKTLLRGFVGYLIQMLEDPSKEPDANLRKALEYINNQINILKLDEQAITTNLTKLELNILQSNIQGNASNYTSSSSVNRSNYVANPTY
ncbi:TPA: hypothetical protein DEP21_01090 [Patescibacteria group bacterium]|nr:hypothetical protein [Candidatus Gracilibacteria bacterium]